LTGIVHPTIKIGITNKLWDIGKIAYLTTGATKIDIEKRVNLPQSENSFEYSPPSGISIRIGNLDFMI
jgi:hypothetical protein